MAYSGKKTLFMNGFANPRTILDETQKAKAAKLIAEADINVPTGFESVYESLAWHQYNEDRTGSTSKSFSLLESASTPGGLFATNSIMGQQGPVTLPGIVNPLFPAQAGANTTAGSADVYPTLLPIAVQPVRKTNFFDFLGAKAIFQMNSQSGLLYFMDGIYSGGRLNSSIPTKYIETTQINPTTAITDSYNTAGWGGATNITTVSQIPLGAIVSVLTDGLITVAAGAITIAGSSPAPVAATLIYVGTNPYSGNSIFQVLSFDNSYANIEAAVAAGKTMYFMSKALVLPTGEVSITTASIAGGISVVEATLQLTSSPKLKEVSETEVYNFGFTMIDQADYVTPRFAGYTPDSYLNLTQGTGATANQYTGVVGSPNFTSVAGTTYAGMTRNALENFTPSQVDIKIKSVPVEATGSAVRGTLGIVKGQDLRHMFKMDGVNTIKELMGNAIAQDLNMVGNSYVYSLGQRAAVTCDRVEGTTFSTTPAVGGMFDNAPSGTATGTIDNTITYQRRMVTLFKLTAAMVGHRNRNDRSADKALIGKRLAEALIDNKENIYNKTEIVAEDKEVKLGKLGNIELIKATDRKFGYESVLFGQTATNESDNGLKFCPYIMAALTETTAESTHAWSGQLTSRFAFVEAGWYPENAYLKLAIAKADIDKVCGQNRI